MGKPEKIRIGELLIQQGLLTQDQLKAALGDQKRTGRKLGRVLIDNGYLSEDQLGAALAQQLQAEFVDLRQANVEPELAMRLPQDASGLFVMLTKHERWAHDVLNVSSERLDNGSHKLRLPGFDMLAPRDGD